VLAQKSILPKDLFSRFQLQFWINFLRQNGGKLSKRALNKDFEALTDNEVRLLKNNYQEVLINVYQLMKVCDELGISRP